MALLPFRDPQRGTISTWDHFKVGPLNVGSFERGTLKRGTINQGPFQRKFYTILWIEIHKEIHNIFEGCPRGGNKPAYLIIQVAHLKPPLPHLLLRGDH